jgi:hypothetical protein
MNFSYRCRNTSLRGKSRGTWDNDYGDDEDDYVVGVQRAKGAVEKKEEIATEAVRWKMREEVF